MNTTFIRTLWLKNEKNSYKTRKYQPDQNRNSHAYNLQIANDPTAEWVL